MANLDSPFRSIVKALSYRSMGALLSACVALVLTGQIGLAVTFGLVDFVVKFGAYYVHERIWERIHFGRVKATDYEI